MRFPWAGAPAELKTPPQFTTVEANKKAPS
jgi:hypothetical protein